MPPVPNTTTRKSSGCNFFPSNSISVSAGPTTPLMLTISALSSAQAGAFTVDITASSADAGSKTVDRPLSVTVTSSEDYSLVLNPPTSAVPARQMVSVPGTVTGLNGYTNAVQLSCVNGNTAPPSTCALNPAAVNAGPAAKAFTLMSSNNTAGTYSFSIQGVGGDASATTHTAPMTLTFFDLTITTNPNAQTVNAGQSAAYSLNFTPEGPSTFPQTVTYSCGQLPSLTTCSFQPSQIASGSGVTPVTLTISTTAAVASLDAPGSSRHQTLVFALCFPLVGLVLSLAGATPPRRKSTAGAAALGLVLLLTVLQSACGGGLTGGGNSIAPAQPGTAPGSYTVMITATEGAGAQALQPPALPLTLTVQ